MKRLILWSVLSFAFIQLRAQVTVTNPGNTVPALNAAYSNLNEAIQALQLITNITGPVIISVSAPQTAPSGGYEIRFAAVTNPATPIVISGNNNIVTAFSPQPTGSIADGIFKIIGADYVTIENFILQEDPANNITSTLTNNMTEWGVALLLATNANGAQNNHIHQNTISLNKAYSNSFGIYSNACHSASTPGVSLPLINNTGAPNHGNYISNNIISNINAGIAMIGAANASQMDNGNFIGSVVAGSGNEISNWGGQTSEGVFIGNVPASYGVLMNHQVNDGVWNNTIVSAALTGTSVSLSGIQKDFSLAAPSGTFSSSINNNILTIRNGFSGQTSLAAILNRGISSLPSATININDNVIEECTLENPASVLGSKMTGILNESSCGILNINNNIFRNNVVLTPHGSFDGIANTAAVTDIVNLNNNQLGNASAYCVSLAADSYTQVSGIRSSTAGPNAALSISGNNFQGFSASGYSTNSYYFILFEHTQESATTDNINNNTFTDLYLNTLELVMLIARNGGAMRAAAGATLNINQNRVVGTFTKVHATATYAGNTVLIYDAGTSEPGNKKFITGNNFSNISSTGENGLIGLVSYDGNSFTGGPTTYILDNTFENIATGEIGAQIIRCNNYADTTFVSGNRIRNISTTGAVVGIEFGQSSVPGMKIVIVCDNNELSGFSSTGTGGGTMTGIYSTAAGTRHHIYRNTITGFSSGKGSTTAGIVLNSTGISYTDVYKNLVADIVATHTSGFAISVGVEIGAACSGENHIQNNYIGAIRSANSSGINIVRGVNILSVVPGAQHHLYFNTIYLDAPASTGTNFGSSGIYATSDASPLNGMLTLRNNIIVNVSEPKGTGVTAAYRRSSSSFQNFSASSNNNIYYAGAPGPFNAIFRQVLTNDQDLAAYQARVAPRENNSQTEAPPFINPSDWLLANYLHIDPLQPTKAESGAVNMPPVTFDYDDDIRQGNPGYSGTGTAPDIGADEFEGLTVVPINVSFFHAFKLGNSSVRLIWKNENETTVGSYVAERSNNGSNFSPIGSLLPHNNNGGTAIYQFDDSHPFKGDNFYRIVSRGINGRTAISETRLVRFSGSSPVFKIYPNPVTGKTARIIYDRVPAGKYQVMLYDAAGSLVMIQMHSVTSPSGELGIVFRRSLPEGGYVIKVMSDNEVLFSEKLLLVE